MALTQCNEFYCDGCGQTFTVVGAPGDCPNARLHLDGVIFAPVPGQIV